MKTITFYSYKGGVGRTMALANVAWRLAEKGKRVAVMDLDLEAPGLSLMADFVTDTASGPPAGLSGYLERPRDLIAKSREATAGTARQAKHSGSGIDLRRWGKENGIGPFCHWISPEEFTYPGVIVFLPVGRTPLNLLDYLGPDHDPDQIASVKQAFVELECDYLLIDSRTGLTATSSIASIFYPDEVVVVLGLNSQNIKGTEEALTAFRTEDSECFSLLPSLVPYGEEQQKEKAFACIRESLARLDMSEDRLLAHLSLPYHPQLAVEDRPMLVSGTSNFLAERYDQLTEWLIAQNKKDPLTCIADARELVRNDKTDQALELLSPLCKRPPFHEDVTFLALYAEACTKTGFTVEASVVLDRVLSLEAGADKVAGGSGVPTIKTVLLANDCEKKAGASRAAKLPRLFRVKDAHRADESDEELGRLYSAISETYKEEPIDIPGFIRFNEEVVQLKPDFAPAAATMIAEFHAYHGQHELANTVFLDTYRSLEEACEKGKADQCVLGSLLWRWAALCAKHRDFEAADEKLRKALDFVKVEDRVSVYLERATILSKASREPRKSEIQYLEQVIAAEPESAVVNVIRRLATLYENEGSLEDALEMRKKLLEHEPWDRFDGILRVRRLQKKLGWESNETDECEATKWLKHNPCDVFSIVTLAEMALLCDDIDRYHTVMVDGARRNEVIAPLVANAIASHASERWESETVVQAAIRLLHEPVFCDYSETYAALRKLHTILGEWEQALDASRKAASMTVDDRRTTYIVDSIELLERLGRWEESLSLVEEEFARHVYDVNWPLQAARAYERAAAFQDDQGERELLLARALVILEEFETATGPMQLDSILPLRYTIIAERLADEERARRDFKRVQSQTYERKQDVAVRALPGAEWTILMSTRRWKDAVQEVNRMARYANDEQHWKQVLYLKADLLFSLGRYQQVLDILERLGKDTTEGSLALQFTQLRCLEAMGNDEVSQVMLARIRDKLKPGKVENLTINALSRTVCCELRCKKDVEAMLRRVRDCLRWIDIRDINQWSAQAQSTVALYHLTFGSSEEAERSLRRLQQIGYYFTWVAEFVHDLRIVCRVHSLTVDVDGVASRFPLD